MTAVTLTLAHGDALVRVTATSHCSVAGQVRARAAAVADPDVLTALEAAGLLVRWADDGTDWVALTADGERAAWAERDGMLW